MTEQPYRPQFNEEHPLANFTFHDIIDIFKTNLRWFVVSVLLCVGVAYLYLASTPYIYKREAMLLIKDSRKGGDLEMAAFSDLVGFQNRRNVDNELYILRSRRLMAEVVKQLNLTTDYTTRQGFRKQDLYKQSPIQVTFINDNTQSSHRLRLTLVTDNSFRLSAHITNSTRSTFSTTLITSKLKEEFSKVNHTTIFVNYNHSTTTHHRS